MRLLLNLILILQENNNGREWELMIQGPQGGKQIPGEKTFDSSLAQTQR